MRHVIGRSTGWKIACIVCCVVATACTGKSPTAPTPQSAAAAAPTPSTAAAIFLTPDSWDMPAGGGALEITVRTSANTVGNAPAAHVVVTMTASSGTLSDPRPQTDATGHARVTWTGTSSATLRARAGDVEGIATIRVPAAAPTPAPAPPPGPSPGPGPTPPPTPAPLPPNPLPPSGPTPPRPAGDLVATITATPPNPDANQTVTFSIALASSTGATVPAILRYTWDVNGDRLPDRTEANPTASYLAGTVQVFGEVYTADDREVRATLALTVGVTPALSATMTATPSRVGLGEATTLTANVTPAGNVGTLSYGWDVDGNGTIDQTTSANSMTTSYATIGLKAPKVTVTGSRGPTTTATESLTVAAPTLSVSGLRVSGTQTTGSLLTFTATVSAASGSVPPSMAFRWEFGNGLEVVTGASPNSINHTYASPGKYDVRVTVTAPDGRTATDTIQITVS